MANEKRQRKIKEQKRKKKNIWKEEGDEEFVRKVENGMGRMKYKEIE